MRVRVSSHKKPVSCGGCGKGIPAGRSFYLPRWKGGGARLCGRCGMAEINRQSKPKNDVGVAQEALDLSVE